ncbi:hypothetical protein ACFV6Y_39275 [Streptomyces massasporeus]|uniref:hypothetical protein n=1 Tax=Streptomyces massasporeus TaxID=67324 RepID=UPI00366444D6
MTAHKIEDHVKVPLVFNQDAGRWEIADEILAGQPLTGMNPDQRGAACECDDAEDHEWVAEDAAKVALPTAEGLLVMLAQAVADKAVLDR